MNIKKYLKTVVIVLFVIALVFATYLLLRGGSRNYPDKPLPETNLSSTEVNLDPSFIKDIESGSFPVYYVQDEIFLDDIEEIIGQLGKEFQKTQAAEGKHIQWQSGESFFAFESVNSVLVFEIENTLDINESEDAFTEFFSQYLDQQLEFSLLRKEEIPGIGANYFSYRILDNRPFEFGYGSQFSDRLSFDETGKLKGGKVLLLNIEKSDFSVPTISKSDLNRYLNTQQYPKEVYVNTYLLMDELGISYLDPVWGDISQSVSNCVGSKVEIVYLYNGGDQYYIYPTYKVITNCDVQYNEQTYSVPGVFYVNAIDPKYLSN